MGGRAGQAGWGVRLAKKKSHPHTLTIKQRRTYASLRHLQRQPLSPIESQRPRFLTFCRIFAFALCVFGCISPTQSSLPSSLLLYTSGENRFRVLIVIQSNIRDAMQTLNCVAWAQQEQIYSEYENKGKKPGQGKRGIKPGQRREKYEYK